MEYMIDFSIIIPHYNNVKGLKRLLCSIYENEFNGEVLVIDDRSSDSYKNKLNSLSQEFKEVHFFVNGDVKGPGSCRNIGIKKAKGKWLLFADTDDIFLKKFVKIITRYKDSDCDVVYFKPELSSGILKSDYQYKYGNLVTNYKNNKDNLNVLKLKTEFGIAHSKLVKSCLLDKYNIKFDQKMMFEDSMFGLKVGLLSEKIDGSEDRIYKIIDTSGSLSKVKDLNYFKNYTELKVDRYIFEKATLSRANQRVLKVSRLRLVYGLIVANKNIWTTLKAVLRTF